jgi:molybdate transport system regulatory protein
VDVMNRCWLQPLVDAVPGGGAQRGARVTEAGREVLAAYRALEAALVQAGDGDALNALRAQLRQDPRPSHHPEPA